MTNNYVNSSSVPMQLDAAGYPYYQAILVDDTNLADAVWTPYVSSNIVVNLGATGGWHGVWIGLRGHADAPAAAVWQWNRLKLDWTPPVLVITSPTNDVVTQPWIQLEGYSSEPLSLLRYDISNAAGTASNQVVAVTGQDYNTTTFEYTTTYFHASGVSLTNGLNVVTLHATDYAGNTTIQTANFTLNYSSKTNPPVVQLLWPQNGLEICGSAIVCRGWVDDDTATVTVQLVDANGQTNRVGALVGCDGIFYANSLTLASGSNYLSYTVTDAAGNVATTNITVSTSDLELTIDPVSPGQSLVTGTIGGTNYAVEVNGVSGVNNGDGTWAATMTPIGIGGGAVVVNAAQNEGDPSVQQIVQGPQGAFVSEYHQHGSLDVYDWNLDNWNYTVIKYAFDWLYSAGGTASSLGYTVYNGNWDTGISSYTTIPECGWPQPMPPATMVTVGWLVTDPTTGYVETNVIGLLTPPTEHADINQPGSNALIRSSDDGKMSLATGGPVGSVQQNLWCLSATATDQKTGLPIPAGQISIGGFGCQDTNAQLWVPLRDNDTNDVTAHVTGVQNYSYTITVNEYPLVYQTRFVALTDPNPARLNLGVGEYVDFQALPDAVWSATGGGLAPNYGGRTFTAASNAPPGGAAASVTARYHGLTKTVNFTVFPPTGYDPASTSIAATSSAYAFLQGEAGAGMHVQVCIAPTSVSFYRVGIKEIAGPGTNGWGYFAQTAWNSPPIPDHSPNRNFVQLDSNNYWVGLADYDDCHFSISPTPPTAGGFTWNIPVVWQIDPNTTNSLCYWGQTNSFDVNGTVTVSKYGLKVTRTINNVWNPNL